MDKVIDDEIVTWSYYILWYFVDFLLFYSTRAYELEYIMFEYMC